MGMRPVLTAIAVLLLAAGFSSESGASGSFDSKLSPDRQILQALDRLTFGARPGDVAEVRRLGVEKWIELQLHPERTPENPELTSQIKPLETLHMDSAALVDKYFPRFPPGFVPNTPLNELLSQDQQRKVLNGTAEERQGGHCLAQ